MAPIQPYAREIREVEILLDGFLLTLECGHLVKALSQPQAKRIACVDCLRAELPTSKLPYAYPD